MTYGRRFPPSSPTRTPLPASSGLSQSRDISSLVLSLETLQFLAMHNGWFERWSARTQNTVSTDRCHNLSQVLEEQTDIWKHSVWGGIGKTWKIRIGAIFVTLCHSLSIFVNLCNFLSQPPAGLPLMSHRNCASRKLLRRCRLET